MVGATIVSGTHIVSIVLGFLFMWLRTQRLGAKPLEDERLTLMLSADNWAGIVSMFLIGSGLARLLHFEKSPEFFFRNGFFWIKMSLYGVIFLLEMMPMVAFIGWRIDLKKGKVPDTSRAPLYRRIGQTQLALLFLMPFCAAAMARGLWLF